MTLRPISGDRATQRDWLRHMAELHASEVFDELGTSRRGLNNVQVEAMRDAYGPNTMKRAKREPVALRFAKSFLDPFALILIGIAVLSVITDIVFAEGAPDYATPLIIGAMVLVSGTMQFVQEERSGNAAEALQDMIRTTCNIERLDDGRAERPMEEVVVGDVIHLAAGDMVPADLRLVAARDLFVSQSSLTGESEALEKMASHCRDAAAITDLTCIAFQGSTVVSGTGVGVAVAVGEGTLLGEISAGLGKRTEKTAFERGIDNTSQLLVRLMLVMAPVVFLVNGITKGDWLDALLFALSVAVGLTPEMLPMLVTGGLAKGAADLSADHVIVKRLDAIQNLGSIDLLCTDKTGTLTEDRVVLERHLDIDGNEDPGVLAWAFLNSFNESGLRNLIDSAIIARANEPGMLDAGPSADELADTWTCVDEIPFDYERRLVSVVVADPEGHTMMVTKGAIEEVLSVCCLAERGDAFIELTDAVEAEVRERAKGLADEGMRVLGVCRKAEPAGVGSLTAEDECDMVFVGYLAFLDPPKESSAVAIEALRAHGVSTKVLTGDAPGVAAYVCRKIGMDEGGVLTGTQVERMSDEELAEAVEGTIIFAKLAPDQKARVVSCLRDLGHVVGYMGDGVNDAAAMRASDCGISVDSAVDVARESADIILLEKDLQVLERGIEIGRKTYANMAKYLKLTVSGNFGNIFSVVLASVFLPFLPMAPVQLLLLNLVNDIVSAAIPWDAVDEEQIRRPRAWDVGSVRSFMQAFGPTSTVIDLATFAVLFWVVCPAACGGAWGTLAPEVQAQFAAMFQAGWLIVSAWTQVLVVHIIRTEKLPFVQSRASWQLTCLGLVGLAFVTTLPFTPLAGALDLAAPPVGALGWLLGLVAAYLALVTVVKRWYMKKYGTLL